MVIKTSLCVALACAGLGPVAAGLVIHSTRAGHAANADRVAPWGRLATVSGPVERAPATLPITLRLAGQEAGAEQATETETVPADRSAQPLASINPDLAPAVPTAPVPGPPSDVTLASLPASDETTGPITEGTPPGDASDSHALLDINTASVAALNHIPGLSNAGRAIVRHRPYRTIEDLLAHRVLKSGDFLRVKSYIKT